MWIPLFFVHIWSLFFVPRSLNLKGSYNTWPSNNDSSCSSVKYWVCPTGKGNPLMVSFGRHTVKSECRVLNFRIKIQPASFPSLCFIKTFPYYIHYYTHVQTNTIHICILFHNWRQLSIKSYALFSYHISLKIFDQTWICNIEKCKKIV